MRILPVALATSAAMAVAPAVQACGGDPGGTECTCASPTVYVDVPAPEAANVLSVTLSGEACGAVSASCVQPAASGCTQYAFQATAVGACTVNVTLEGTPANFSEEVSFAQVTCCPGYYVEPPGASPIEVPGALDAGSVEPDAAAGSGEEGGAG